MVKNYLKIAFRNLARNKTFSIINIFGLSFGLTCCLLMIIYIRNELDFDRFHKNASNIYRVSLSEYLNLGGYATTPLPIGPALKTQMPEVKMMTRINFQDRYLVKYEDKEYFEQLCFADENFFNIFSFPFLAGDPESALKAPNSIVISEAMAKKYFGDADPINKILQIGTSGNLSSVVTGVFKTLPQHSQLQFSSLVSTSTWQKLGWTSDLWDQMPGNYTYVLLNNANDAKRLENKFPSFVKSNVKNESSTPLSYKLILQPLTSVHLQSHLQSELAGAGNISYIYLFGAVAMIILLIACINFINFTTANAISRTKEIGVRKVIGAKRPELIIQFLCESFVTFLIASIFAILFAQLLLPLFNQLAGKSFSLNDILQPSLVSGLLFIGISAGIIAGFFPAWSISGLNCTEALKGRLHNSNMKQAFRKSLVTLQFVASMSLTVAAAVVYRQMQFVRKSASQQQGEQVMVFQTNNRLNEKYQLLKNQLLLNANVLNVAATTNAPGFSGDSWPIRLTENSTAVQTENYVADPDFLYAMNIPVVAGRTLDAQNATDVKEGFVINETCVRELGFSKPGDAVGQTIWFGGGQSRKRGKVVGVISDFHFRSLHEKIAPALMQFAPYDWMTYNFMLVKLKPENISNTISFIKNTIAKFDRNWLVDYKFFDDNFASLHYKDEQQGKIFAAFAVVAIFISCLGLFGLTMHASQQRLKEIGIRKVLGASVSGIVELLSKDFLILVLIAALVAFPIAWWTMHQWLSAFAYRINLDWTVFVLPAIAAFGISIITISFQSVKAALSNPVESLRSE
jgi:putative ABC transport system permease protein